MIEVFQYVVIAVIFLSGIIPMVLGTIDTAKELRRMREAQKHKKQ